MPCKLKPKLKLKIDAGILRSHTLSLSLSNFSLSCCCWRSFALVLKWAQQCVRAFVRVSRRLSVLVCNTFLAVVVAATVA